MRTQLREQLVEPRIRDTPRRPVHHLRPIPAPAMPDQRLHRIVMGIHPAGTVITGQRERVDHRPGARLQVEVVEPAQHRLAMRHRRRRIPATANRLAGHRIHTRPGPCPHHRANITVRAPPVRPDRLVHDLQPATEIAGLHPSRLIPGHPQRPQEPKPPQQIHPVRTLSGRRSPARRQLGEIRRDRRDDRTAGVNQPIRLKQIAGRRQTTPPRHHQHRQIPWQISIADHELRT
jgi:hypothetical protein